VNPARVNIFLGDQQVCRNGAACNFDRNAAHAFMLQPEYTIRVQLASGKATLDFLSCDLTAEYVHVNADYST
jgi:glutamate N-acetyltransferase / amino-acid N-acetyltransferase